MKTLDQSTLDNLKSINAIISCGIDENVLYVITKGLDVRYVKPTGRLIPRECFPTIDGKNIVLYFNDIEKSFKINSDLVIKNSTSSLSNNSTLSINDSYMCNLEIDGVEHVQRIKTPKETGERRSG